MLLVPFCKEFPEWAEKERFRIVLKDPNFPNPKVYEVVDLYCPEEGCNCNKVSVVAFDSTGKACATIAWGWKSPGYYSKKWGLDYKTAKELSQGFLDPYGKQSEGSEEIFEEFVRALKSDPGIKKYFQKRYRHFKKFASVKPRQNYKNEFFEILNKVISESR